MLALLGAIIVVVVAVLIKVYDDEIRKNQFYKSMVVYSWLIGVALIIIGVVKFIWGIFN